MASADGELEEQLLQAGNKLVDPPASVDELLSLLDTLDILGTYLYATQRTLKPYTNANGEAPVILSKSETHGDFNNGSKSECFTTENTPKKPRTQRLASPKPDTNVKGETPGILSKSETQGDFNNGSKSEIFRTENTPKKPRTQRLASPKPDTNANGETPVNLSNNESLIEGKVPITKAIKKLRFILNGKELKSPAKRTHTGVSKNNEKPQPPKSRRRTKLHVPPSPPDLPEDIGNHIREMCRTQEVFVIQKSLYESDVKRDKKKVSMPLSQINPDFLKETEREALDQQKPIGVQFVEPSNTVYAMVLRQWDMPKESGKKSSSYVLRTNWNNVVATNELEINTVVQIWSL
ncbi:hypothetical protein SO802_011059 [Lithocarpus litseifolius]|uniref:B3 domain-containing protein n=1 Tax=Lithocarpus litseifolius TaxID=425828 RepID=A0AAW2DI75_9ROSI